MNATEAKSYLDERFHDAFSEPAKETKSAWTDGKITYIETKSPRGKDAQWRLTSDLDDTDVVYDIAVPKDPVGLVQLIDHIERKNSFNFDAFITTLMPAI